MRKINFIIFVALTVFTTNGQVIDDFESGFGANHWKRRNTTTIPFDLQKQWEFAETPFEPISGNSPISDRENIGSGNTVAYWLASQAILINENDLLVFDGKQTIIGDQGSLFEIWVTNQTQEEWNTYENLVSWHESEFSTVPNESVEKAIPIGQYAGSLIHIAFVRRYTQNTPLIGGDRWIIDNIRLENSPLNIKSHDSGKFSVYPNPTSDLWNIISNNEQIEYIRLTDISGKIVLDVNPISTNATIDGSILQCGFYIINISTKSVSSKMILVKK